MDLNEHALELHKKYKGKFSTKNKIPITDSSDLSLVYSPGVAAPCRKIAENKDDAYTYTAKSNTVAVVSDGSAVLGLGNIGAQAALPVMEGKAALFKEFADIDAVPICLDTQDTDEIISICTALAPSFGGINLEDISAPRCFEIEKKLSESLPIPIFHDDQHGTAIVVLAGLMNAAEIVGKELTEMSVVINGAGAAGVAITKLLLHAGLSDITVLDSSGVIDTSRTGLNESKQELARITKPSGNSLSEAVRGKDVFIGVSVADALNQKDVGSMADDPIIFALANPDPEILPEDAIAAGAKVVATGRSDYPNQVNNVLVFPGVFRGLLDARARLISDDLKVVAARAIASCVDAPSAERIIPESMDRSVVDAVARAVAENV